MLTPYIPNETISIYSPILDETVFMEPIDWKNIWVYGMEITVTGYITRGEFRKIANRQPFSLQKFQFTSSQEKNISIPIQQLHPINDLFENAKTWSKRKISDDQFTSLKL